MSADELIDNIFTSNTVQDQNGKEYPLNSNVDENEGNFLRSLIEKHKPKQTIEVGCAYGLSSLYICSALEKQVGSKHHTIIDGYQSDAFHNIGVANLNKANVDFYELIEGLSEIELPKLLAEGKKYDFCFIDGNHTFDHTLLDFFYLNRMLNVGGIMVFDDAGLPSISKALRYLLNYPAYQYADHLQVQASKSRKIFDLTVKRPLNIVANLIPKKIRYELFAAGVNKTNNQLHLNTSMIALQKIKEDEREWFWFNDF